jgi:hypothetical protein
VDPIGLHPPLYQLKLLLNECLRVFNTEEYILKIISIFGINIWYVPVFFFNSDFFRNSRWGEKMPGLPTLLVTMIGPPYGILSHGFVDAIRMYFVFKEHNTNFK